MKKFRKKPVVIEAYQTNHEMDIPTLEGTMLKLERMQSKAEAQERAAQAELEAFIEAH